VKDLDWIGSSKRDLKAFPDDVQDDIGYALHLAQVGEKSPAAKPLKGLGSGVMEIVDRYNKDTYRAVYTVQFDEAVYVLHAFQKKSASGIKTPKPDVDLIKKRLRAALRTHKARMEVKDHG
jgi:phage-related protein